MVQGFKYDKVLLHISLPTRIDTTSKQKQPLFHSLVKGYWAPRVTT